MKFIKSSINIVKRFLSQKPIKTFRTIFSPTRLFATFWVEYKKISFEDFINLLGVETEILNQSKNFVKKFLEKKKNYHKKSSNIWRVTRSNRRWGW